MDARARRHPQPVQRGRVQAGGAQTPSQDRHHIRRGIVGHVPAAHRAYAAVPPPRSQGPVPNFLACGSAMHDAVDVHPRIRAGRPPWCCGCSGDVHKDDVGRCGGRSADRGRCAQVAPTGWRGWSGGAPQASCCGEGVALTGDLRTDRRICCPGVRIPPIGDGPSAERVTFEGMRVRPGDDDAEPHNPMGRRGGRARRGGIRTDRPIYGPRVRIPPLGDAPARKGWPSRARGQRRVRATRCPTTPRGCGASGPAEADCVPTGLYTAHLYEYRHLATTRRAGQPPKRRSRRQ